MYKFGVIVDGIKRVIIFEFDSDEVDHLMDGYEMSEGQLINQWKYIDDFSYYNFIVTDEYVFNSLQEAQKNVIKEMF